MSQGVGHMFHDVGRMFQDVEHTSHALKYNFVQEQSVE